MTTVENMEKPKWEGPTMARLVQEGLGLGIDATKPEVMLHTQIEPTEKNLVRRTVGTGYQELNETLETASSVKKSLSSNLRLNAIEAVSFNVKYNWHKEENRSVKMRAQGKKIYCETVLFDYQQFPNSSRHLRTLLEAAAKQKGHEYCPGKKVILRDRESICRNVVRNENQGVTHYISEVDLGAMVYEVKVEQDVRENNTRRGSVDIGGVANGIAAEIEIGFSSESMQMASQAEHKINFVIDKDVELKGEHTSILPEQEKMISYKVTPIWHLIDDPDWRQSVKKACQDYVDDCNPIAVDSGSFLILCTVVLLLL